MSYRFGIVFTMLRCLLIKVVSFSLDAVLAWCHIHYSPIYIQIYRYTNHCLIDLYYIRKNLTKLMIVHNRKRQQHRKEMFYLTTHSTHFIYGYMASDIW